MKDIELVSIEGDLESADKQIMIEGMLAYHASQGHPRKTDCFSVAMKDENGKLRGCIIVTFLWNGMEIQTLWVEESWRGQGWGSRLMKIAEAEAEKRGCNLAYTNTFSWQAPDFYTKLGYTVYGRLENFPHGNTLTYFCKKLAEWR